MQYSRIVEQSKKTLEPKFSQREGDLVHLLFKSQK